MFGVLGGGLFFFFKHLYLHTFTDSQCIHFECAIPQFLAYLQTNTTVTTVIFRNFYQLRKESCPHWLLLTSPALRLSNRHSALCPEEPPLLGVSQEWRRVRHGL